MILLKRRYCANHGHDYEDLPGAPGQGGCPEGWYAIYGICRRCGLIRPGVPEMRPWGHQR